MRCDAFCSLRCLAVQLFEAEIDGVEHEYSAIEGVHEDVMGILLNLKGVAIVMEGREETTVTLSAKGPGVVTAGDIEVDSHVEIIKPRARDCYDFWKS